MTGVRGTTIGEEEETQAWPEVVKTHERQFDWSSLGKKTRIGGKKTTETTPVRGPHRYPEKNKSGIQA